ncbi:FecR family protein [Lacinutrix sp. Bg11-31]|uniref:FecR family protein n=1 Tax=Lacinutrix sp. Bg11-31 TaxID=2057808 RepID=UPI000C30255E|nr:FecR family protein [Lacinutrix sp. Bg11-31]AUC82298.1 anti-sigma factor [Lacinutrix sp. Bg11-31]
MKREDLIKKWLDNNLNSQELEAFKQLEDFDELTRLDSALQQFKSLDFESESELEKLNLVLKNKTKKQNNWLKPFLRVAAILAICFSSYYYTTTLDTNITTEFAEKENVILPDNSQVKLNAKSTLAFNKSSWSDSRDLDLNGEAYFKVAKGSKFTVHTSSGNISVLGTEFNVKNRVNLFEVICYEGSVKVEYNETSRILKPGERFLILENTLVETPTIKNTSPFWINNESAFKSMPYTQVIAEFERQYNVTFSVNNIDTNQLFTGRFAHNNLDIALQVITIPLNLAYTKNNNKISLKRE